MTRLLLECDTDDALLVLGTRAALAADAPQDLEHLKRLEQQGVLLMLNAEAGGGLLHLYVDQAPLEFLQDYVPADGEQSRLIVTDGFIRFGSVDTLTTTVLPNPKTHSDEQIPAGNYAATSYRLEYASGGLPDLKLAINDRMKRELTAEDFRLVTSRRNAHKLMWSMGIFVFLFVSAYIGVAFALLSICYIKLFYHRDQLKRIDKTVAVIKNSAHLEYPDWMVILKRSCEEF